nr:uncharacterized protein LOC105489282 isoform X3 [Macaca nemestrina]
MLFLTSDVHKHEGQVLLTGLLGLKPSQVVFTLVQAINQVQVAGRVREEATAVGPDWKGDLGLGTSGKPLQTPACQDCSGAQREADGVIHLSRWGKECWGVLDRGGKGDGQRVVVSPGQFSGAARLTFLARRGTSFACFPSAPAPSFQTNVARKLGRFLRLRHLPICRGRPLKTDRPQRRCQCK